MSDAQAPRPAAQLRRGVFGPAGALLAGALCACEVGPNGPTAPVVVYPDAEAYESLPSFTGAWSGKVERIKGELQLGQLRAGEYFGNFTADDGTLDIALHLEQSSATTENGAQVPSNRLLFTWQDGDGGRGHGWFKIDREGATLEGSSGVGEAIDGVVWLFGRAG